MSRIKYNIIIKLKRIRLRLTKKQRMTLRPRVDVGATLALQRSEQQNALTTGEPDGEPSALKTQDVLVTVTDEDGGAAAGLPHDYDEVQGHYLRFRNQYMSEDGAIYMPHLYECTSCSS